MNIHTAMRQARLGAFSLFQLCALSLLATLASCDDNTGTLGVDIIPGSDFVDKHFDTYDVTTTSYAVGDKVPARSSMSYLGRFTDPETGTMVKSDFLAQFHCSEDFSFPEKVKDDKITSAEIRLFVKQYVGDSLANFKLNVYPLTTVMDAEANYYTDLDPTAYYDAQSAPLATKWYSISDRTISDAERESMNYTRSIRITLPTEIGQAIYDGWRTHREYFENTETWLNSPIPGSRGFYFQLASGDGAIAYIDVAQFNLYFDYYDEDYGKDTLGICQFASTEEVVQATRFENSKIDQLLDDTDATYLKSPAGIFTMATLPTSQIDINDTINSAKLTFVRYNDKVESRFKLDIPQKLLLVRLDDYNNGYFEKYNVADNITSYITTFDKSTNTYTFNNIARLISTINREKQQGTATANADKVLLIPVETTYDSSGGLVKVSHLFSMSSTKLVGGERDRATLEVIYSQYKQ